MKRELSQSSMFGPCQVTTIGFVDDLRAFCEPLFARVRELEGDKKPVDVFLKQLVGELDRLLRFSFCEACPSVHKPGYDFNSVKWLARDYLLGDVRYKELCKAWEGEFNTLKLLVGTALSDGEVDAKRRAACEQEVFKKIAGLVLVDTDMKALWGQCYQNALIQIGSLCRQDEFSQGKKNTAWIDEIGEQLFTVGELCPLYFEFSGALLGERVEKERAVTESSSEIFKERYFTKAFYEKVGARGGLRFCWDEQSF